jgi:hypothetical protein
MKPWSSPVLLAVGWYLLMPPFVGGKPHIEAPLSRWDQAATFTSQSDCSDERDRQFENVAQEAQQIETEHEQSSNFNDGDQFSVALQIERKHLSGIDPVWLVCSIGHGYVDRNNVTNRISRTNLHSDRAFTGIERQLWSIGNPGATYCASVKPQCSQNCDQGEQ